MKHLAKFAFIRGVNALIRTGKPRFEASCEKLCKLNERNIWPLVTLFFLLAEAPALKIALSPFPQDNVNEGLLFSFSKELYK